MRGYFFSQISTPFVATDGVEKKIENHHQSVFENFEALYLGQPLRQT